jgi:hypothetical protein
MSCQHHRTRYVRVRIANGTEQIRRGCVDCRDYFGANYRHNRFTEEERHAMPVIDDYTTSRPPCVVCGTRGTEEHHWAPRALFGDEAYLWPTSWLCPGCHQRWHQTIGASA